MEQLAGLHGYDNILVAGKAGILLSALSGTEQLSLDTKKVNALARASRVSVIELPTLLKILEDHKLINVGTAGVEVLGVTGPTVLERAADVFENLSPEGAERAALELAERASISPIERADVGEYISDTFNLATPAVTALFEQAEEIGFVDHEEIDDGRRLYFNGNLFRRDCATKAARILASLSSSDAAKIRDVDDRLRRAGCMLVDDVRSILSDGLFEKLASISLYDINVVNNSIEDVAFITRPAAFSKFGTSLADDALDLAKAFVSSLTYGMTRSSPSRGHITMIQRLMDRLVRGEWVGSATAIGEDYRALELRNVIQVREGESYGYDMRLVKKDVGEMALAVIESGDTSERSLLRLPGAPVATYSGPELNREAVRKRQSQTSKAGTRDMVMALRTGKLS
jgi:hypothetical protein